MCWSIVEFSEGTLWRISRVLFWCNTCFPVPSLVHFSWHHLSGCPVPSSHHGDFSRLHLGYPSADPMLWQQNPFKAISWGSYSTHPSSLLPLSSSCELLHIFWIVQIVSYILYIFLLFEMVNEDKSDLCYSILARVEVHWIEVYTFRLLGKLVNKYSFTQ